jgi:hypothetical protein
MPFKALVGLAIIWDLRVIHYQAFLKSLLMVVLS